MIYNLLVIFAGSLSAGLIGSITGLGGGVILVPLLTLGFGVDIRYAVGTSLISVIATSSGAASSYLRQGLLNIRIGMFLEIATTIGAICGASVALFAPTYAIAIIFGLVLIYSAISSFIQRNSEEYPDSQIIKSENRIRYLFRSEGSYKIGSKTYTYPVKNMGGGFAVMWLAGILSGLLGIGSGALKVIALDKVMKLPFKVSTSTSNFMIGVTAAASAGIYLRRGYIDPVLSMPVILGVLIGSFLGAAVLLKAKTRFVRVLFSIVITLLALEMIYNGITKAI